MTCTIHHFPTPPAHAEAIDRRAEIVLAARAILRSPARHDDATLTEACVALQTWGDGNDYLTADAMLLTMRLAARKRAREAAVKQARRGTIRLGLLEEAALLMFGAAVLVVGLAL